MWVARFVIETQDFEDAVIDKYAKKHKITATGYPLTNYEENGKYFFISSGFVNGPKNKIQALIADLKKDSKVRNIDIKGNLITLEIEGNVFLKKIFDPHFITVNPIIITSDGKEIWELGSWNRIKLIKAITELKKIYGIKLLSLSKKKINQVSVIQTIPSLTEKQKEALEIAVQSGYYDYPRKSELKELAEKMHTSLSTYREHLRLAEKKTMPRLVQ